MKLQEPITRTAAQSAFLHAGEPPEIAAWRKKTAQEEADRLAREAKDDPDLIITLVHGTQLGRWFVDKLLYRWARRWKWFARYRLRCAWIEADGPLGLFLRRALHGRAQVVPFYWTGYNGVGPRADAAQRLRAALQEQRERWPRARQIVIAHSHGGNVAMMAMDSPDEAKVLGVATLGTPFFASQVRSARAPIDWSVILVAAVFTGFAVVAGGFALDRGWSLWPWGVLTATVVGLALAAGVRISKAMHRHAERIHASMPDTALTEEQVRIVRTTGDEAAAVIAGARVAGAVVDLWWRKVSEPLLSGLADLLETWDYFGTRALDTFVEKDDRPFAAKPKEPFSLTGWIYKGLPYAGGALAGVVQEINNPIIRWSLFGLALVYAAPAALVIVLSVCSLPCTLIVAIGLWPCGWGIPFAGPYLDVTAEPAPAGTWQVTQIKAKGLDLAHSRAHDDWAVFEHLAGWIKTRESAVAAPVPQTA